MTERSLNIPLHLLAISIINWNKNVLHGFFWTKNSLVFLRCFLFFFYFYIYSLIKQQVVRFIRSKEIVNRVGYQIRSVFDLEKKRRRQKKKKEKERVYVTLQIHILQRYGVSLCRHLSIKLTVGREAAIKVAYFPVVINHRDHLLECSLIYDPCIRRLRVPLLATNFSPLIFYVLW